MATTSSFFKYAIVDESVIDWKDINRRGLQKNNGSRE